MAIIRTLALSITAQTGDFAKGISKMGKRMDRFVGKLRKQTRNLSNQIVALAGVAGFGAVVKKTIETSRELELAAKRINTSTEALSALRFVVERSGGSFDDLADALQEMQLRLVDVAEFGAGEAAEGLQLIGLEAMQLRSLRPEQQFAAIAEAIKGLNDQGQRIFAADALFGDVGVRLLPVLLKGSAGLKNMTAEAQRLGHVMSNQNVSTIKKTLDLFVSIDEQVSTIIRDLVVAAAPAVAEIAKSVQQWFDDLGGVKAVVDGIVSGFTYLINLWKKFALSFVAGLSLVAEVLSEAAAILTGGLVDSYDFSSFRKGLAEEFHKIGTETNPVVARDAQNVGLDLAARPRPQLGLPGAIRNFQRPEDPNQKKQADSLVAIHRDIREIRTQLGDISKSTF